MRSPCRKTLSGARAAAGAIGLVATLAGVLLGGCAPTRAPAGSRQLSPFTGEPAASPGPVLAVKIDNLAPARPQTGLTDADIVYVLPVEGGLSRILAVFSSHFPPVIGPVRSARKMTSSCSGSSPGRPSRTPGRSRTCCRW
jgi:Protein of unknown function (DUF3048) N-terminal domain